MHQAEFWWMMLQPVVPLLFLWPLSVEQHITYRSGARQMRRGQAAKMPRQP